MDNKLSIIISLIIISIIMYLYSKININDKESDIEGKWMGGVVVITKDYTPEKSNKHSICYHNGEKSSVIPSTLLKNDKIIIPNESNLPFISDDCKVMQYDRVNDIIIYPGKVLFKNFMGILKLNDMPTNIHVMMGRNSLQVVYYWNPERIKYIPIKITNTITNREIYFDHDYLTSAAESVVPFAKINESYKYILDLYPNIMDKIAFGDSGEIFPLSNVSKSKITGNWLGGSLKITKVTDNSLQLCSNGAVCSYARIEGNRINLTPYIDIAKDRYGRINEPITKREYDIQKRNVECNSLYYDNNNDVLVWFGDKCINTYSDLNKNISKSTYIIIGRDRLIFHVGDIKAASHSPPEISKEPAIWNPMDVLIRPYD